MTPSRSLSSSATPAWQNSTKNEGEGGFSQEERHRIELTASCRDADGIPKVPGAGEVRDGVQLMHNGVKVVAGGYYGAWMTEVIRRLHGHHEPQEELAVHAVIERLAQTDSTPAVMELGAFWAYYSCWALHRIPLARAFLVEPDPNYLRVGLENLELNGFEHRVQHVQASVGSHKRAPEPFECESDGRTHLVSVEGLDSLLERWWLERVDLLFVDVQGAERPLLEGGWDALAAGKVRFLVLSTHHHQISGDPLTHQRCLDMLRGLGAHVVVEHTVGESFSGDGLIVAAFDDADHDLTVATSRCRVGDSLFGDPLHDLAQAWFQLGRM